MGGKDKEKGKGKLGEKDKEKGTGKMGEKDKENGKGKMGENSKEIIKWTKTKVLEPKGHACPFRLWGSWMQNERSFQIKTLYSDHKCARDYNLGSLVTFRWIAKHYAKEIILNPSTPIRSMQNDIREKFLINVSMGQCKRAKQFALYEHEGGLIEHYSKLWEYRKAVLESNPGLTCHIDQVVDDDDGQIHFSRLYVCYKGLKDGWIAGCRRVIGIDGCFLTHHCKGELLSVIGRDANNQMFPIAWAVVRVENKNNWCWFLSLLSDDLGLQDGLGITVISDAHKGLEEAVTTWLPQAEHRHCTRHIYANFKKKWSGVHYKRMFWAAATSTVEQEFLSKMEDIRRFDPEAHAYLMKREPASWCKAFFQPAVKCVAFENGISESFNGKIVTARGKPIITMLEDIRVYVMQRHWTISKQASELEDTICPSIRKKIEILKKKMRSWQVCPSGYQVLEVRKRDEAYGVNLIERSCFCKLWDLSGIPCVHAVAAYMHLHMDPELGVCDWYTQSKWHDAYQFSIKPVFGSKMWKASPNTPPLPPIIQKMPGRPRKKRVRHPTENDYEVSKVGRQMTCQLCYKTGHNKQTCTTGKQPKPQKSGKPPKPPGYKHFSKNVKGKGSNVGRGTESNMGRGGGNVGRGGGSRSKRGGGNVGRGGGSSSKRGGGIVGRGGGSSSKRGGGSDGKGGGSNMGRGGWLNMGRGGGSVGKGGGSNMGRGGGLNMGRGGGSSMGRGGRSNTGIGGGLNMGRGGGSSIGRGGGLNMGRGGGSNMGRGGGSTTSRGSGSSSKRGGGSIGRGGRVNSNRGGMKRGWSSSFNTEDERQLALDEEAAREVFAEVNAAREKEMLEIERNGRIYQDWDDVQWNITTPLQFPTISELEAVEEAHEEYFNNMDSITTGAQTPAQTAIIHVISADNVSNNEQPTIVSNNEQPTIHLTPEVPDTSSQSSRVVLNPRPRSERIAKRRKLADGTADKPFTL